LSCTQERAGSSRALFQEGQQTHSANSTRNPSSRPQPSHNDITMEDANNNKRQNNTELAEPSKRRTSTGNSEQRNHHQYHKLNLWFNFPTMEQLAKEDGQHPIDLSYINYHMQRGVPQDKARTLSNAKIAYPRVPQKHWPKTRLDGKPSQHLHLTQIPFDAEIDVES
jgi:hypothetical protein